MTPITAHQLTTHPYLVAMSCFQSFNQKLPFSSLKPAKVSETSDVDFLFFLGLVMLGFD